MSAKNSNTPPQLILTYDMRRGASLDLWKKLPAGSVAAVIFYDSAGAAGEAAFQKAAEPLVSLCQSRDIPVIIAENSSLCGRLQADGLHMEEAKSAAETVETLTALRRKYGEKRILGYGNPQSRHNALEAGEARPDYVFFGKLGMDKKPQPHSRNRNLAAWWAELVQIDCIVQAGSSLEYLPELAAAKAEFIALEEAVFAAENPPEALLQAQKLLLQPFAGIADAAA